MLSTFLFSLAFSYLILLWFFASFICACNTLRPTIYGTYPFVFFSFFFSIEYILCRKINHTWLNFNNQMIVQSIRIYSLTRMVCMCLCLWGIQRHTNTHLVNRRIFHLIWFEKIIIIIDISTTAINNTVHPHRMFKKIGVKWTTNEKSEKKCIEWRMRMKKRKKNATSTREYTLFSFI